MKKIISLLLSLVMLFSITAGLDCSAYAAGWASTAQKVELNCWYCGEFKLFDGSRDHYYDAFIISLPAAGTITLSTRHSEESLDWIDIYKTSDIENRYEHKDWGSVEQGHSTGGGYYWSKATFTLPAGDYYVVYSQYLDDVAYEYCVFYNPSIAAPSNLKVSTRNRTSLKLSWTGVSNADGYKLQQKIDGTWITKATTSSTYTTMSNLTPGKNYYFRVRAYINVDGKNYYSLGRTLTTCTKPATVTLSGLSRYSSGHKIKATWKKVSGYASGYQIYWSRNSSFSNVVAKTTVSGQSITSYTGKNFTKGRRYYVKVRAYKTVNGTKYYGSWSNVKSIVCK